MFVDHIAVLTTDLRSVSDPLPDFCRKEPIESFPSEGTQEQYVKLADHTPWLLLLQPIAEGPYARALSKRGPGLHHMGAKTPSIKAQISKMSEHGLLLHPISITTLEQGVVWLCRPGVPFLIELAEGEVAATAPFEAFELGLPSGLKVPDFAEHLFPNVRMYTALTDALELKTNEGLVRL